MNSKDSIRPLINGYHTLKWLNHLWYYSLLGCQLTVTYYLIKITVQHFRPWIFFDQYQKGILACLAFYVFLQALKKPPSIKDTLKALDQIVQHSRASTYWQYRDKHTNVTSLLLKDCHDAFNRRLKPLRHYIEIKASRLVVLVILLFLYVLVSSQPSISHDKVEQMLAYNDNLQKDLNLIEASIDHSSDSLEDPISPLEQEFKSLERALSNQLEKTYTVDKSLDVIRAYDQKRADLIASTENKLDALHKEDREAALSQLEKYKHDAIRDQILDALNTQEEQETLADREDSESLTDSFTELMSQAGDNAMKANQTLEIASENTGTESANAKNGQGASGKAYADASDDIENGEVFKTEDAEALMESKATETLQISGKSKGDTHLTLASDLKSKDVASMTENDGRLILQLDDKIITLPQGIPEDRLPLIQAYMKENE